MPTKPRPSRPPNHKILLAVTGLSPQVVTETLYALATASSPWIPDQVHILTTAEGAQRARLSLLSQEPGWFARLLHDYNLPPIAFDEAHIHIIQDDQGRLMDDIRDQADNIAAADYITETVRRLTESDATQLHVSIAGGRKTLGFYLGYALSLYGRPQDRLSHVLVSEPYESSWEFFYPTPYSRVITTRDNKLIDTRDARVTLGDIPFVRLRRGLPRQLLFEQGRYSEAVEAVTQTLAPATLEYSNARLSLGGEPVTLPPVDLAFYLWLAMDARTGGQGKYCPNHLIVDLDHANNFLNLYHTLYRPSLDPENPDRTQKALARGMDKNFFERRKSGINKRLRDQLGQRAAPYLIQRFGKRPKWRHGIGLEPDGIRIEL
jgi:CRISPR-associated protein (TIGR02584 family)